MPKLLLMSLLRIGMKLDMLKHRNNCRFCHKNYFNLFLDLGKQPSQGAYLEGYNLGKENFYPLKLYQCQSCLLVQLLDVVEDEFFQPYLSSVTLTSHFKNYAGELIERFLKPGDFVVEFGSNDGVLLKPLQQLGIEVLGVEPDKRIAKLAREKGIPTLVEPFTQKIAKKIKRKAKMVVANNVFAHIDDMDDVMKGIDLLLEDGGLFIFEVHNFLNILAGQYDNIYFEHLNYYTVSTLAPFLSKYGFHIFEVKPIPTHGGSIRVYTKKLSNINLDTKVKKHKKELVSLLKLLKNKKIIGFGAAGRANTLLNYCGIDTKYLDYIVDESPSRYGKFTPGTHIRIIPPSEADFKNIDYVLILAWNYEKEIREKLKKYNNLKFIIPLPKVRVI